MNWGAGARRWGPALVSLLVIAAATWSGEGLVPGGCPSRQLTGVPCVLCGGTRAMAALGRGEVGLALRTNPMVAAVALGTLAWPMVGASGCEAAFRRPGVRRAVWIVGLALALANWVYLVVWA